MYLKNFNETKKQASYHALKCVDEACAYSLHANINKTMTFVLGYILQYL